MLIVTHFRTSVTALETDAHHVPATQMIARPGTWPTITIPMAGGRRPDVDGAWSHLEDAADFFGIPMPPPHELTTKLDDVAAACPNPLVAVTIVVLEADGVSSFAVSGTPVLPWRPVAVRIAGDESVPHPHRASDPWWRRMAARTTSRGELDQRERWLTGRGFVDGVTDGQPLLGAVIVDTPRRPRRRGESGTDVGLGPVGAVLDHHTDQPAFGVARRGRPGVVGVTAVRNASGGRTGGRDVRRAGRGGSDVGEVVMSEFDPSSFGVLTIDGYGIADGVFSARYTLRGNDSVERSGDVAFTEVVDFGGALGDRRPDDRLLRLLALTCSPSYFKAAAPPRVEIAFPTREFERHYLRELIAGGLGEFAYRNSLPAALTPAVEGPDAPAGAAPTDGWEADADPLVPVGGGKDSVVTIEALKRHGFHPTLFSVNKFDPIDRCIDISGLDSLRVTRRIDPRLIEANAQGAHNGHVPVTAINSVIGLIVADTNGFGPVVLSNERSSNVGNVTWLGRDVNHQWSKSISYESLLRDTLTQYGLNPDRYFSLLRPLSESEIADRFRSSPQYFRDFISCNRPFAIDAGRRGATWCGHCPKCLFVFGLMAPRLGRAEVEAIFGRDLFADVDNRAGFEDIVGLGVHKPFECVGEYYEAAESLIAVLDADEWRGVPLVEEFRSRRDELEKVATSQDAVSEATAVDYVPARYAAALALT